jgi:hypothetical protein
VRLTPQFLRALHLELFTKPSFWVTFYEIVNLDGLVKSPSAALRCNFALLDKRLRILERRAKMLLSKGENLFGANLKG